MMVFLQDTLTTKTRKLESEVHSLQSKLDTIEDEQFMKKELASSKTKEESFVPVAGIHE